MIPIKFHHQVGRLATKKNIIILFILAHLVLLCMMIFTFPKINTMMGTQAFDLKTLGYSYPEAMQMIQSLDEATKSLYLFPQLFLLDILYPLLLALLLSTLIIRLQKLGQIQGVWQSSVYLLPFLAMCLDYAENLMIARMLILSGEITTGLVQWASFFTLAKGLLTTICWILVVYYLFVWYFKRKNKRTIFG